jgi:hypothetical protein
MSTWSATRYARSPAGTRPRSRPDCARSAPAAEATFDALAAFAASPWGTKYPQAARVFEAARDAFTPVPGLQPRRAQAALRHQRHRVAELLARVFHVSLS